ncbi:MAG: hypothetical protein ABSG57_11215 [Candidatus Bathyarchaeia archaeon]
MEQSTVALSKERLRKLNVIRAKTGHDNTEIVGDFIDALYSLIVEGLQETQKVSLTNWEINLANSTIRINAEPLFNLSDMPSGLQKIVLDSFGYDSRFRDIPRKEQPLTPERAKEIVQQKIKEYSQKLDEAIQEKKDSEKHE